MQEASSFSRKRKTDGEEAIATIPGRSCRVRCREAVFHLAAVLIDLDCADANRRPWGFALPHLRVEFGINEYDARTRDRPELAHLSLPFSRMSQISWSVEVTILSLNAMSTRSLNGRSENFGGTSSNVFLDV